jgi:hypothetical protein
VVWNKEQILFARPKDTKIIDLIPLSEVTDVTLTTEKKFKLKLTEDDKMKAADDNKLISFSNSTWSLGRKIEIKDQNVSITEINSLRSQAAEASADDTSSENVSRPAAANQVLASMSDQKSKSCGNDSEILHIKTKTDGFNSGRTYCLRTDLTGTCQDISADLMRKARAARIREEKLTRFQKNQMKMSKLYNSTPFQALVSVLILAVRTLSAHTRFGSLALILAQ